jgi:hypothetical protein
MTNVATTPDSLRSRTETTIEFFDNWFDPIESGVRDRVREFDPLQAGRGVRKIKSMGMPGMPARLPASRSWD